MSGSPHSEGKSWACYRVRFSIDLFRLCVNSTTCGVWYIFVETDDSILESIQQTVAMLRVNMYNLQYKIMSPFLLIRYLRMHSRQLGLFLFHCQQFLPELKVFFLLV